MTADYQQVIRDCHAHRVPVFIGSNGIDIAFQTYIRGINGAELYLENMVKPEYIRRFTSGTHFTLQCQMVRLQTSIVAPHGSMMAFTVQANSLIDETRQAERFAFAPEEKVTAEFVNPYDQKTLIQRTVMDMSATGLSIRMTVASRLFQPGTKIDEIRVNIDKKPYTKAPAEIVYGRKFLDLKGRLRYQVGLKLLGRN